jgi:hypothetical protein
MKMNHHIPFLPIAVAIAVYSLFVGVSHFLMNVAVAVWELNQDVLPTIDKASSDVGGYWMYKSNW